MEQLEGIISLIRGDLLARVRLALINLVITDTCNRDSIQEQLLAGGIADPESFEWIRQMRYYWEDDQIVVKLLNYDNEFTYEYLGDFERLIITPLTNRCFMTISSAVNLFQGAAP